MARSDDRPAPGSISATDLAKLGVCEKRLVLDKRFGPGKRSSVAEAARLRGIQVHERSLQAAVASGAGEDRRCFIASAVYGSDAPETVALRSFRDATLRHTVLGRVFIRAYYWASPPMAHLLRRTPRLALIVRMILNVLVRRLGR